MSKRHRYRRRHARAKALRPALETAEAVPETLPAASAGPALEGRPSADAVLPHLLRWLLDEGGAGQLNRLPKPTSPSLEEPAGAGRPTGPEFHPSGSPAPAFLPPAQRSAALALASVLVCDGHLTVEEQQSLAAFLEASGQEPLRDEELRPWLPSQLLPPPDPRPVLEALTALAHADGERDETEWRLVSAYARAWGFPAAELQRWSEAFQRPRRTRLSRLLASLRRLLS